LKFSHKRNQLLVVGRLFDELLFNALKNFDLASKDGGFGSSIDSSSLLVVFSESIFLLFLESGSFLAGA
jgi:hypothetical protein